MMGTRVAIANDRASVSLARASRSSREAGSGALFDPPSPDATSRADTLSEALRAVRLTGAVFFVIDITSPWCIEMPEAKNYADIILPRAQHVVSYHIVVAGGGWAGVPGAPPIRYDAGDILVFPHGDAYAMRSAPDAAPDLDPGQTLDFFRAFAAGALPFVVSEGGGKPPPARLICGFLGCDTRPFNPLLSSLPRMLRLRRAEGGDGGMLGRLIELTLEEAQAGRAGGESVTLRLSELLFIELLRRYATTAGPKSPGWLAGLHDPRIARALKVLHGRPAESWTVASLARVAGLSRSGLAERFASLVGLPPARYLTLWRMQLASQALLESRLPVAEVGRSVGYESEAAFSRTFKRIAGASPQAWRGGACRTVAEAS